jgi:hypothetical protein
MKHTGRMRPSSSFSAALSLIQITNSGPDQGRRIFLFKIFFVTDLKAQKGLIPLSGNVQYRPAEL